MSVSSVVSSETGGLFWNIVCFTSVVCCSVFICLNGQKGQDWRWSVSLEIGYLYVTDLLILYAKLIQIFKSDPYCGKGQQNCSNQQ